MAIVQHLESNDEIEWQFMEIKGIEYNMEADFVVLLDWLGQNSRHLIASVLVLPGQTPSLTLTYVIIAFMCV